MIFVENGARAGVVVGAAETGIVVVVLQSEGFVARIDLAGRAALFQAQRDIFGALTLSFDVGLDVLEEKEEGCVETDCVVSSSKPCIDGSMLAVLQRKRGIRLRLRD
jgi:hypothetical protein